MAQPKKILIVSLGCAKNLVDTEVMCGQLASAGFLLTNIEEAADIMLINTCSFIQDARSESRQAIEDAAAWRKAKPGRKLVVGGCWPQQRGEELRSRFPDIDLLVGLDDVPAIAEILADLDRQTEQTRTRNEDFAESQYLYDHTAARLQLTPSTFAYVKIAEGCDHGCRFCSIPSIRGRLRSRSMTSVLTECENLLANGVRELNFIGQDVTAYGRDRGEADGLVRLLDECEKIKSDFWLRLLYTHPRHVGRELFARLNENGATLPYLDMPLQHIDDGILRNMGRGMGEAATRRLLDEIRSDFPEIAVRTTFIVGYPGETEAAFAKLLDLVREYRFRHVGVFTFSAEPGTGAARLSLPSVAPAAAEERKNLLLSEQQAISAAQNRALIGARMSVLAEGLNQDGMWRGRTAADAPEVDGLVFFSGGADCLSRGIVEVEIERADAYDLYGTAQSDC